MDGDAAALCSTALEELQQVNPDSPRATELLENLAMGLALLPPDEADNVNCHEMIHILRDVLRNSNKQEVQDYALTCLTNYFELAPHAVEICLHVGLLPVMGSKFQMFSGSAASSAVGLIYRLRFGMERVAEDIGPDRVLDAIPKMRRHEQGVGFDCVIKMMEADSSCITQRTAGLIIGHVGNPDVRSKAIRAFRVCVKECSPDRLVDQTLLQTLMNLVRETVHPELVLSSMGAFLKMSQNNELVETLTTLELDYEKLLLGHEYGPSRPEIVDTTLRLLMNLLPNPAKCFCAKFGIVRRRVEVSKVRGIAAGAHPVIERYILTETPSLSAALMVLAQIIACLRCSVSDTLLTKFVELAANPNLTPMILAVIMMVQDKKAVVESGLKYALSPESSDRELALTYAQKLSNFQKRFGNLLQETGETKRYDRIEELLEFISTSNIKPIMFRYRGYVENAISLLKSLSPGADIDLSPLAKISLDLLNLMPAPQIPDTMSDRTTKSLVKGQLEYSFKWGDERDTGSVSHVSLFASLEAWLNERHMGNLRQAFHDHFPEMSDAHIEALPMTQIGLLHRILGTPGWRRYSFRVGGKPYTYLDTMFFASTQNLSDQDSYRSTVPVVECIPETPDTPQVRLGVVRMREIESHPEGLAQVLQLVEEIHRVSPQIDLRSPGFEERFMHSSKSVWFNASAFNPAITMVMKYPYLFGLSLKNILLRLTSFDMFTAISYAHGSLLGLDQKLRDNRAFWPCTVRRAHLFEDGCAVLEKYGPGSPQIDITFDGEAGFGSGPTHEFYELMAKEFTLKSRNLWRTMETDSPYAFSETGLFPRPDASTHMFYVFGILCAKAAAVNMVLPIPLGRAFFKLIGNEKVSIDEVDPVLGNSLKCHEGLYGMPFTYPGIDSLEMVPDGGNKEVTEQNVEEYVSLVHEFTCGSKLDPIRDAFNRGFHTIVGHGIWETMTASEKQAEIIGSEVKVDMEQLQSNLTFEHGYSNTSPQVRMLLETLCEMSPEDLGLFFKFVTGCEHLPIGGLAAVHPRISVAMRIVPGNQRPDEALPTASTCTNYFKMPQYSSKRILKEKLIMAIREGQEAFLLS